MEKKHNQFWEKICGIFSTKILAIFVGILFVLLLVPIFQISFADRATGDDFNYAIGTHAAWLSTHSVWEVMKAAKATVVGAWHSWQGTWFDLFLFTLQPEVFHPKAYVIVPYMMLFLWISSTFYLFWEVCRNRIRMTGWEYGLVTTVFLIMNIGFIPSTKSSIFWYNGAAHYMIPFVICQINLTWMLKYTRKYRIRYLIGMLIAMTCLGGANYQAALFGLISAAYVILYDYLAQRNKRIFLMFVPFAAELIGLIISMESPGNINRAGEDFGFSFVKSVQTIGKSFVWAFRDVGKYLTEKPLVFVGLFFLFLVFFMIWKREPENGKVRYPVWSALLIFCLYCAMQTPEIYAEVPVSRGVYNTNFQVFMLTACVLLWILAGALAKRMKLDAVQSKKRLFVPGIFVCVVLIFVLRHSIKQTTFWVCHEFHERGRDELYKRQQDEWSRLLLDPDVKNVTLLGINDDQGPFMFMPATPDPKAWTNTVMCSFYQKESIVAISWDEWIELYGQPDR